MAKKKIKTGQIWKHLPSGGSYEIIHKGQSKIPHVGWFKSVTYKDENGKVYTRFLEDFILKFIKKPREVPSRPNTTMVGSLSEDNLRYKPSDNNPTLPQ